MLNKEGLTAWAAEFVGKPDFNIDDLNHAHLIIEKMREDGWTSIRVTNQLGQTLCVFFKENKWIIPKEEWSEGTEGHSIALAALKAKGVMV